MKITSELSYILNFMRWFSAFLVVVSHLRSFIFIDYKDISISHVSIFDKLFYFLTGFGHEAVIVFFLLSGFLIGGNLLYNPIQNWKIYFIKRFSRIYIVFIPALLIGGFFDIIGGSYFNYSQIYNQAFDIHSLDVPVLQYISLKDFSINSLMMQTSLGHTFGSNGPLWSLAYEWWYYVLLPLLIMILKKKNIYISSVLFVLLLAVLNNIILLYFLVWILGAFIYKNSYKINIRYITTLSFGLFIIILTLIRFKVIENGHLSDFILAGSIAFLLNNMIYIKRQKLPFTASNTKLADFSYSLYLFHYPFVLFITSIISLYYSPIVKLYPSLYTYLTFLIILFMTYVYAYCLYALFEKRTDIFRKKLLALFN